MSYDKKPNTSKPPGAPKQGINFNDLLKNPQVKELKPLLNFSVASVALVAALYGASSFGYFDWNISNTFNRADEIRTKVKVLDTTATSIAGLNNDIRKLQDKIDEERTVLEEAKLVRTTLNQNYSFLGYFQNIVTEQNLNIVDMKIDESSTVADGLKPVNIVFTSTYDQAMEAFKSLYTRRILYIEDLAIENLLNDNVRVSFTVKFRKEEAGNENAQQQQQQTGAPATETQTQTPVENGQQGVTDTGAKIVNQGSGG